MKVLIQDKASLAFLFSAGSWTDKEEEALDFESPRRARAFCAEHQLQGVVVIIRYGGLRADETLSWEDIPEEKTIRPAPVGAL